MQPHMFGKIVFLSVAVPTQFTRELLNACVNLSVSSHTGVRTERFVTYITVVISSSTLKTNIMETVERD